MQLLNRLLPDRLAGALGVAEREPASAAWARELKNMDQALLALEKPKSGHVSNSMLDTMCNLVVPRLCGHVARHHAFRPQGTYDRLPRRAAYALVVWLSHATQSQLDERQQQALNSVAQLVAAVMRINSFTLPMSALGAVSGVVGKG